MSTRSPRFMPNRTDSSLHLVVPSLLERMDTVVDRVEAFLAETVVDEDLAYRILLVASEAVTNAIKHGNAEDPTKQVTLTLDADDEHVYLRVRDEGEGFSPEEVSDPRSADNLLSEGGRGLFLIENMSDDVRYEDEGRRIVVTFNREVSADSG